MTTSILTEEYTVNSKKPSPASVKEVVDHHKLDRYKSDLDRARREGLEEGFRKGRQEVFDWLEAEYTGPKAPDRDSVEGKAILQVARDAGNHFLGKLSK